MNYANFLVVLHWHSGIAKIVGGGGLGNVAYSRDVAVANVGDGLERIKCRYFTGTILYV